jgi:hypothetical protein
MKKELPNRQRQYERATLTQTSDYSQTGALLSVIADRLRVQWSKKTKDDLKYTDPKEIESLVLDVLSGTLDYPYVIFVELKRRGQYKIVIETGQDRHLLVAFAVYPSAGQAVIKINTVSYLSSDDVSKDMAESKDYGLIRDHTLKDS